MTASATEPLEGQRLPDSVLLLHDDPAIGPHHDWMLAALDRPPADPDHRCLVTFRLVLGIDPRRDEAFTGERLPDHRAAYLHHEGPTRSGRGSVRRLWRANLRGSFLGPDRIAVTIDTETVSLRIEGRRLHGQTWSFRRVGQFAKT